MFHLALIVGAAILNLAAWDVAAPGHASRAAPDGSTPDAVRVARVRLSTGVELQVIEHGPKDGDPVLFLHGFTDSWRSFAHVLDGLPSHVRAIVPSQRGHGDSERAAGGGLGLRRGLCRGRASGVRRGWIIRAAAAARAEGKHRRSGADHRCGARASRPPSGWCRPAC